MGVFAVPTGIYLVIGWNSSSGGSKRDWQKQEYPGRGNPGPVRAPFPISGGVFCHIPAKKRTLLHTF